MRRGPLSIAALVALGACDRDPLPFTPAPDAGSGSLDAGGEALDAGSEVGGPPAIDWAIAVGTQSTPSLPGSSHVVAVVALDDGGAVVAGSFTGTVSFAPDKTLVGDGSGAGSGFVARYRKDQRLSWVTQLHGDRVTVADMAGMGNDEVVVAGWFASTLAVTEAGSTPVTVSSAGGLDAFVIRVASDGSVRWMSRGGGSGDDIARAIAVLPAAASASARIAITGAVGDGALFGAGPSAIGPAPPGSGPIYLARLDGNGEMLTVSYAGGGVPGQGYGVAVDLSGEAVVTGFVNGVAPFGTALGGQPLMVDPANGRAFVARWNDAGIPLWAQSLGGPDGEGDAIAIDAGGNVVACGQFEGQVQFGAGPGAASLTADVLGSPGVYLTALDREGGTEWARRLTGVGIRPWRVRAPSTGELLVAASFGGGIVVDPDGPHPTTLFSMGDDEAAFIRLRSDGVLEWAFGAGGPGKDEGFDIAAAADGTTWGAGDFVGPAVFGVGAAAVTLDSGTDGNGFLLHLGH